MKELTSHQSVRKSEPPSQVCVECRRPRDLRSGYCFDCATLAEWRSLGGPPRVGSVAYAQMTKRERELKNAWHWCQLRHGSQFAGGPA